MLKYTFSLLLWLSANPTIAFEPPSVIEPLPLPANPHDRSAAALPQPVSLADGQTVANPRIVGPSGDLLPPYVATRSLHGEDYFEWTLRWNKLEEFSAKQRVIPPRTLRGSVTNISEYTQGFTSGRFGSGRFSRSYSATVETRPREWRIGGYGGGPVTYYNPFVTR